MTEDLQAENYLSLKSQAFLITLGLETDPLCFRVTQEERHLLWLLRKLRNHILPLIVFW
jgi:hypothetical protein